LRGGSAQSVNLNINKSRVEVEVACFLHCHNFNKELGLQATLEFRTMESARVTIPAEREKETETDDRAPTDMCYSHAIYLGNFEGIKAWGLHLVSPWSSALPAHKE